MSRPYRAWEVKVDLMREFSTLPDDKGKANRFLSQRIIQLRKMQTEEKSKTNKKVIEDIISICEKIRR